jgi:uncharacterized membrane protein YvbJ
MIICTKCGASNQEEAAFCAKCGHKFQSVRRDSDGASPAPSRLLLLPEDARRGSLAKLLRPYIEAWAYVLALIAATVILLMKGVYWPLYLLAPAAYLLFRWRKI